MTIKEERVLKTPGSAVAVTWSPDGSRIAAASYFGTTLTVWDRSGREINQIDVGGDGPQLSGSIAFVNGSSQLLFAPPHEANDNVALSIRDVASGKVVGSLNGPNPGQNRGLNRAERFAITRDQSRLVAANIFGEPSDINLWTYDTRDWKVIGGSHENAINSLSVFGPDDSIVAGLLEGTISIFAGSLHGPSREYRVFDYGGDVVVAGSPDGKFVFAGHWKGEPVVARVIRASDGIQVAAFPSNHPEGVIAQAAWGAKDRFVAFVDLVQEKLFLWNPFASRLSYAEISAPGVMSVAVSPDGSSIAVADNRGVEIYAVESRAR